MPYETSWREDLRTFALATKEHWKEIVGGSAVFVLIGVFASMGLNVPPLISGIAALCFAIALSAFLCWRDEHAKIKALTRPNLRGYIVSIGIGGTDHGAAITILLQITNTGPPTIADGFTAIIGSRQYPTVYLPPNSTFSDDAGNVVKIHPADMLYEKLKNRIPENDRVSGFLFFVAKDISASELTNSTPPPITVRFRDASQKEYSTTAVGPGQAQPLYEPGVRNPFISLYSGKQHKESEAEKNEKEQRRRKRFAEKLAVIMDQGRELVARLRVLDPDNPQPTQDEIDAWWASAYMAFSFQPLSAIYIARFNAANDPSAEDFQYPEDRSGAYKRINSKLPVLGEFIKELMQPS